MSQPSQHRGIAVWTLKASDGVTRASIVPALGAAVSSLQLPSVTGPREMLFLHEAFWDPASRETRGGVPLLFPICGRLMCEGVPGRWRHRGRAYELPIHGFAMRRPWVVLDHRRPDALVLGLVDGPATSPGYPFPFELILRMAVEPGRFVCALAVRNRGDEAMPHAVGFHPYLKTPPPGAGKEEVGVEARAVRRHRYDDTFADFAGELPAPGPLGVRDPHFSTSLLETEGDAEAVVRWPDGFAARVGASGDGGGARVPYLQLYTVPELPFVCVEPWGGRPNDLNREGAPHLLAGGATARYTFFIEAID